MRVSWIRATEEATFIRYGNSCASLFFLCGLSFYGNLDDIYECVCWIWVRGTKTTRTMVFIWGGEKDHQSKLDTDGSRLNCWVRALLTWNDTFSTMSFCTLTSRIHFKDSRLKEILWISSAFSLSPSMISSLFKFKNNCWMVIEFQNFSLSLRDTRRKRKKEKLVLFWKKGASVFYAPASSYPPLSEYNILRLFTMEKEKKVRNKKRAKKKDCTNANEIGFSFARWRKN